MLNPLMLSARPERQTKHPGMSKQAQVGDEAELCFQPGFSARARAEDHRH
jgi:hypothetical protein